MTVEQRATLRLGAGLYEVASITLEQGARLEATGPVDLRVAGSLHAGERATLGLASGTPLTAGDLRIQVTGAGVGARLGAHAELRAVLHAPSGTVELGAHSVVTGAIYALQIDVTPHARVVHEAVALGCSPEACDDGNPCTLDVCEPGACVHTPLAQGAS